MAGAALAVLIQVIGQMAMGFPIDYLQWILLACAGIGFLFGVVLGREARSRKHQFDMIDLRNIKSSVPPSVPSATALAETATTWLSTSRQPVNATF